MKLIKTITAALAGISLCTGIQAQTETPGIEYGDKFIVFEPQITQSNLGAWVTRTPNDPKYFKGTGIEAINKNYLEFTGNGPNGGTPNSPLEYVFQCKETGSYRIVARMFQPLDDNEPGDKRNDVWIKLAGNFTSNSVYTTEELKKNHKFWGRGVRKWGALYNLEVDREIAGQFKPNGSPKKRKIQEKVVYNLIGGQKYTLTLSGRAQGCSLDYILLFEESLDLKANTQDLAAINPKIYRPNSSSTPNNPPKIDDDEIFYIINRQTNLKIRPQSQDENAPIIQVPNNWTGDFVRWEKIPTNNNYFYLRNIATGDYFRPSINEDNAIIIQKPVTFSANLTQWKTSNTNNGYFHLENRGTNAYIRPTGDIVNDTLILKLDTARFTGAYTQWKFENVNETGAKRITSLKTGLTIYPNPTTSGSLLSSNNSYVGATINIFNLNGQLIFTSVINSNKTYLDLTDQNHGLYIVNIVKDGTILQTTKLLVKEQ